MRDEIVFPFANFNGCTLDVWERIRISTSNFTGYLFMLSLNLIPFRKIGTGLRINWPVRLALPRWVNLSPAYPRKGLSALTAKVPVEWKSNFQINRSIRNLTQIRNSNLVYGQHHDVKPITILYFQQFRRTQNNFGPLNDHIITEFSWVVTMAHVVSCADILRWPATSQWPSSRRL